MPNLLRQAANEYEEARRRFWRMMYLRRVADEYEEARRRVQRGVAEDRDFYVSPFAPNRFNTGPVGPGGSGFGLEPALTGDFEIVRPAPLAPGRAVITPQMLKQWRQRPMWATLGYLRDLADRPAKW